MPSKKKKYNARFPAGRIKKIMQSDEEIGKVAQAVPVIISRTLELFVESLLNKTLKITNSRNAKTLSTSHMKQCIMGEQRFDFLRELVKNIPDISVAEESANYIEDELQSSPEQPTNYADSDTPYDLSIASTSIQATRAALNSALMSNIESLSNMRRTEVNIHHHHQHHSTAASGVLTEKRRDRSILNTADTIHDMAPLSNTMTQTYDTHNFNRSIAAHLDEEEKIECAHITTESGNISHEDKRKTTLLKDEAGRSRKSARQRKIANPISVVPPNCSVIKHTTSISSANAAAQASYALPTSYQSAATYWQPTQGYSVESIATNQLLKNVAANFSPAPPIVSIDFCNKPVAKIDYTNLSTFTKTSSTICETVNNKSDIIGAVDSMAPNNTTDLIYSKEPIINIDLSNIVTTPAAATSNQSSVVDKMMNVSAIPSFHRMTETTNLAYQIQMENSSPLRDSTNSSTATTTSPAATTKKSDPFFELDEDYDNI